jgi:outer membrane lipoprotein SlyB
MRIRSLCLLGAFLFLSACASAPRRPPPPQVVVPPPARPVVVCRECGRIERVELVSNVRATASGGAVLGGVVGGVVTGKPATTAPAARPGVQVMTFRIALRMDDGRRFTLHQAQLASGLRAGSRVRVVGGRVLPAR